MKRWFSLYNSITNGTITKRSLAPPPGGRNEGFPKICTEDDQCFNVPSSQYEGFQELLLLARHATYDSYGTLYSRAARAPKMCDSSGTTVSRFKTKSYPSVTSLSNNGRRFYGVVKNLPKVALCQGLPLVLGNRILATDYVAEHVTELQTPAQFATSMMSGKLPSGAAAPGSASNYDWTQVFGSTGYFYQTWQQLGISAPAGLTGTSPADAVANALGSSGDINNMQILDAPTNSLKAAVSIYPTCIIPSIFSKKEKENIMLLTEPNKGMANF